MGAAGLRRQPVESRSGGSLCPGERSPPAEGALDLGLGLSAPNEPPARENPGPLPGAAALPGRAGGGDSRNLPGDRAGVIEQNRPIYGQRFRRVSGESPGAGRLGGARRTHSAFRPGRLLPCHCLPARRRVPALRGWEVWMLVLGPRIPERSELQKQRLGTARSPSTRPAWNKEDHRN